MDQDLALILKNNLSYFTEKVFKTVDPSAIYMHNWHIKLIAEYLLACQRGEIKRLIINIPPRFLKSISVSVAYPAWLLGHDPAAKIMTASYSQDLSFKHSLDCRLTIESDWYQQLFPDTKLVEDQNTKKKFVTTQRGHRIATSVGGSATGEGAGTLIVDDPHSAMQAQSEVQRTTANTWFDQTFATRLNDKKNGVIIVIMQRLHEDDMTGYLLKKGGWEHLCLPLIAEKDEVLEKGSVRVERAIGHNLHPERMDEEYIEKEKATLGSYAFAGQYQQRPSPEGGGEFRKEWWHEYESITPETLNKYILVDPANSKKKNTDYTSAWVVGFGEDKNCYIVDMIRDKLNIKERNDLMFELHKKHKPLGVYYQQYGIECDSGYMKTEMGRVNYHFEITPVSNRLGKIDRIRRLIEWFYNGRIWFPNTMYKTNYLGKVHDLVDVFIHQEYLPFPVGVNDDMLDALAMLCFIPNIIYPGSQSTIDYHRLYK